MLTLTSSQMWAAMHAPVRQRHFKECKAYRERKPSSLCICILVTRGEVTMEDLVVDETPKSEKLDITLSLDSNIVKQLDKVAKHFGKEREQLIIDTILTLASRIEVGEELEVKAPLVEPPATRPKKVKEVIVSPTIAPTHKKVDVIIKEPDFPDLARGVLNNEPGAIEKLILALEGSTKKYLLMTGRTEASIRRVAEVLVDLQPKKAEPEKIRRIKTEPEAEPELEKRARLVIVGSRAEYDQLNQIAYTIRTYGWQVGTSYFDSEDHTITDVVIILKAFCPKPEEFPEIERRVKSRVQAMVAMVSKLKSPNEVLHLLKVVRKNLRESLEQDKRL